MLHGQLPDATLRLCDFGFSKSSDQSVCKSMCGTPEYMAPEVLFEQQVSSMAARLLHAWGLDGGRNGVAFSVLDTPQCQDAMTAPTLTSLTRAVQRPRARPICPAARAL